MSSFDSAFIYLDEGNASSIQKIRLVLTIKFAISFFCGSIFQTCLACSCVTGSLENSFTNADVVIEVKPLTRSRDDEALKYKKIVIDKETQIASHREVVLRVLTKWKGPSNDHVKMRTPSHDGECAYWFETAETYIVFAHFSNKLNTTRIDRRRNSGQGYPLLYTHLCMENVVKRDDRQFQLIKHKLDRLQRFGVDTRKKTKYTEPLRKRIAEVVKSNEEVYPLSLMDQ